MNFDQLATPEILSKTVEALKNNNIDVLLATSSEDAKNKVLSLVPLGAEVMTMQSMTVNGLGLPEIFNDSGKYNSVKAKLKTMNRETQSLEMQKLGAAPEWTVGSVHAVTEAGQVIVVSNTGSQLPAYVYASAHVIWVVGTQKIVPDIATGLQRINDYILPKESKRLSDALGKPIQSNVSKILIFNKEVKLNRITLIFVPEIIGF